MKNTGRFGLAAVVAGAALALSTLAGAAADKVIKIGTGISEQHYQYHAIQEFKKYVEDKSGGHLGVEIYPNAMLGGDLDVLEAIKLGTVQMNVPTPSVLGNFVKEFRLPDLPYVFPNEAVANRVADSPWAEELLKKLEPVGFRGLAIGDFGTRHITNRVHPITSLADLKGLKLRVMQNPVILDVFRALGANPTPMGFGEVFSALQTGAIDGQENPYATILLSRFYEVQPYLSNSGHMHSWDVLIIGKAFYDGLTPEEQKVVSEGAKIFAAYERKASKESETEALQKLIATGITYTEISPENLAEMRNTALPVVEKHGKEISPEMYDGLMKAIDAASTN
ncbi:TRAP transporter substrate-binding protein [Consotaella salsifontis]|uniref:Tripartite ATP-independent transporter solute receptor, DctP family n=1 Tax=Consotaella salsifontis TaxID=1365950 RepID=A0A1T4MH25_9HYPH|nr:TRAP transporter substrate-binding protein [Consotaella salsifontis]SJZ66146.1 tripartite ATP-independent transporter solute receptor, DctP family [Consotaella salsifontis]